VILLAATVAITFAAKDGCELDVAQLAFVPPGTVRILTTEQCGAITCFERWVEIDGQRHQIARACEVETSSQRSLKTVDP
jgi:hypothetical protein